mgnify:CR=1 FL=1
MLCIFYSIKTLGWNNIFNSLEFIMKENNQNYDIDLFWGFLVDWGKDVDIIILNQII